MLKTIFMKILDLFFRKKGKEYPITGEVRKILVIRTDERLGEIILTLPLINHLRKVYKDADITFLMCKKYESLSKYIDCNNIVHFEKRELFPNIFRLVKFIIELRKNVYDLIVLGGKVYPPSLTSYLLIWIARGRYKVAIRQKRFNPFIDVPVPIDTPSEAFSKYELARKISGVDLPFDNRLRTEIGMVKQYDVLIFTDARKSDHLLPITFLAELINKLKSERVSVLIVSGKDSSERIDSLKNYISSEVVFSYKPPLDELINLIRMSRVVISANTGVMHLSVSLGVPTCAVFTNASLDVWGYRYSPHLMIDARESLPDINEIVNFIRCSIW